MCTRRRRCQVEVFHAVATTAENGEDCPYYLAVLIANKLTAKPQVEQHRNGAEPNDDLTMMCIRIAE